MVYIFLEIGHVELMPDIYILGARIEWFKVEIFHPCVFFFSFITRSRV